MNIEIKTNIYNEKRYGKPWIAKVDFTNNKNGNFEFGEWIGQAGYEGLLILENVNVGDIFAKGKKDNRKPSPNDYNYYIITDEQGNFEQISKLDAYKKSINNRSK